MCCVLPPVSLDFQAFQGQGVYSASGYFVDTAGAGDGDRVGRRCHGRIPLVISPCLAAISSDSAARVLRVGHVHVRLSTEKRPYVPICPALWPLADERRGQ